MSFKVITSLITQSLMYHTVKNAFWHA